MTRGIGTLSQVVMRFVGLLLVTVLLSACAGPLDFDSYRGHMAGEFRVAGRTYPAVMDLKIFRTGLFSIDAGHADKWEVTPSTALVEVGDGHAVWLNVLQASGDLENGRTMSFGGILGHTVEEKPTALRPFYIWLDNVRRPRLMKWPDKGCTPTFPVEGCSVGMILRIPGKHQKQNGVNELLDFYSYPFEDQLRDRIAPEARDDVFISSRYFVCRDQSWRQVDTVAQKISDSGPLQAVAITGDEMSRLFLLCVPPRGPDFALARGDDGTWSADSDTTQTYYNVGAAPVLARPPPSLIILRPGPLYDYTPYFKTVRLPSGSVDISMIPWATRAAVEDKGSGTLYVLANTEAITLDELYFRWARHHLDPAQDKP